MKTMNKTMLLAALLIILPSFTFSQESQELEQAASIVEKQVTPTGHELYLGYGYPNSLGTVFTNGFVNIFAIMFTGGHQEIKAKGPGAAQIGYNYIFQNGFSVGGMATFEPYKLNFIDTDNPENSNISSQSIFTVQAKAAYQYGWQYVRLYHGLSLGLAILADFTDKTVQPLFAFNLIPIGVKIGPEQGFNFYADIGLWSTPIINAGATYRF